MRFGNCVSYKDAAQAALLKKAGFDYVETGLSPMRSASAGEIDAFCEALGLCGMGCEAVNVLFPPDIALTGNNADPARISDYLDEILEKTARLGFKVAVFGSGGARRVPEGFPREAAAGQIAALLRDILAPAAKKYGFKVAVEELNRGETNIINTAAEALEYIKAADSHEIGLTADLFHIAAEGEDLSILRDAGSKIYHCHISNPAGRGYPSPSDDEALKRRYAEFFARLAEAGYRGRVSIEANLGEGDFLESSRAALELMKGFWESVKESGLV